VAPGPEGEFGKLLGNPPQSKVAEYFRATATAQEPIGFTLMQ
jgi:hypothetical protein